MTYDWAKAVSENPSLALELIKQLDVFSAGGRTVSETWGPVLKDLRSRAEVKTQQELDQEIGDFLRAHTDPDDVGGDRFGWGTGERWRTLRQLVKASRKATRGP